MISILAALVATTGWFLAGDPFGVDNAYIAVVTPLVVMTLAQLFRRPNAASGQPGTDVAADRPTDAAPQAPRP
jgi:SSS family solute:Na+ symporter